MKWPKFNVYDFFFVISYLILNFYLVTSWEKFDLCVDPLNLWLLIDYSLLFLVRLLFVIKTSGYRESFVRIINVFYYGLTFPAIIVWSIIGFIWQANDGILCIPDDMVPWSYILWLGITMLTGLVMIVNIIYDLIKLRRLNIYISKMDETTSRKTNSDYQQHYAF